MSTWGGVINNLEKHSFSKKNIKKENKYFLVLLVIVIAIAIAIAESNSNKLKESEIIVNEQLGSEVNGCNSSGTKNVYYYNTRGYGKVKFAGMCWQIIRTTDSGGVKLIYDGAYSSSNGCSNSGSSQQLTTKAFNSSYSNAKYVGLKYDSNGTNSTILSYLNTWYESNLASYESYLEDTVFCNDRTGSTSSSSAATGTTYYDSGTSTFYYHNYDASYNQLYCDNVKDRFSTNNNSAKLSHPIGLMSQPEYLLGGSANSSNVHYTGSYYWLVSPDYYSGSRARERVVNSGGALSNDSVNDASNGVRPSVSLAPGTTYTSGNGTPTNPYVVN